MIRDPRSARRWSIPSSAPKLLSISGRNSSRISSKLPYYNFIGIPGRNLFHNYLRDFVERDRPYRDVATELISAAGDSHQLAPPNFIIRGVQQGDPIQDTWDFPDEPGDDDFPRSADAVCLLP